MSTLTPFPFGNSGRKTLLGSLPEDVPAKRKAFYSFHYVPDNWRASQIRNMGVIEGNAPILDNDWESVKKGGESAIQKWIDDQLVGKSCSIVLIGSNTAGRKWINYEIEKSWNDGKGVVGIYIHNLKDRLQLQTTKGTNPFETFTMKKDGRKLSTIVRSYDPPHFMSTDVYKYIQSNLGSWVNEAISIRNNY